MLMVNLPFASLIQGNNSNYYVQQTADRASGLHLGSEPRILESQVAYLETPMYMLPFRACYGLLVGESRRLPKQELHSRLQVQPTALTLHAQLKLVPSVSWIVSRMVPGSCKRLG